MSQNEQIHEQLFDFRRVSLAEIASVSLLNRVDSKYLLNREVLEKLLKELSSHYSVVAIQTEIVLPYRTAYFDTEDLHYYHLHHNGKLNRYKFRTREYLVSGTVFNEIKHKNNRGKTLKSRINRDSFCRELDTPFREFVESKLERSVEQLFPQLDVYYDRITLVDHKFSERMTIDLNLSFSETGPTSPFGDLVIVELKRDRQGGRSLGQEKLRELRCKESGFSKYCIGIASTRTDVKRNNFKQKLRMVDKIVRPGGYAW